MATERFNAPAVTPNIGALEQIQRRVLWLSTRIVHEANLVRENPDKTKVGGHQASSASVVSILTALYFAWLRQGDRVSIKPHASPAYHAVQYLLGRLDKQYLTTLREFGGLQAYPSRTKDPDPVDFSTGSVGLGAAAPLFAALVDRYTETHFRADETPKHRRRFVAVIGDAELDEGNVWEAISDETVRGTELGNLCWIVDLNRQSLDRVIPGIKVQELEGIFKAAGWHVLEAKYGHRLQQAFDRPGGEVLRRRIDDMSNEEYQAIVRLPGAAARERLLVGTPAVDRETLERVVEAVSDDTLTNLLGDLGGHDLELLLKRLAEADQEQARPSVLFAYTMKGWGLPIAGDPLNHSALLTQAQMDALAQELEIDPTDEWSGLPEGSEGQALCLESRTRLYPAVPSEPTVRAGLSADDVPLSVPSNVGAMRSSQEAFGNTLTELIRLGGPIAQRIVTASPDVSISTNLGGWINRSGVWAEQEGPIPEIGQSTLLRWVTGPRGQHLELGISEMSLFMLLGQLGLSAEANGELLLPVGTVYDPFVCRGLDAFIYGLYTESKFVVAGTPSGVSLSPEGGAHQSTITPSIGIELPNLVAYEPCFQRETEWILLEGLRQCLDREKGRSTYLRLSTKSIEQSLLEPALRRLGEVELTRQTLAGGYRLFDAHRDAGAPSDAPGVLIVTAGALVPDALAAAGILIDEGVAATVINITSADLLYEGVKKGRLSAVRDVSESPGVGHIGELIPPPDRHKPLVTVLDGASHALAFMGGVFGQIVVPLGVDSFGQSGSRADLYGYTGIDADHIINASLLALELATAN
jgi:pyruvate dehydrogenase E1 component